MNKVLCSGSEVPVMMTMTIAPGSDKPGRWLWAENDTLADIAVCVDNFRTASHPEAGTHLLRALTELLPGLAEPGDANG